MSEAFLGQAVWKSAVEGEFTSADWNLMIEVEPISTNISSKSMSLIMDYIRDDKCDGFIIDLGTSKKYVIGADDGKAN